MIVIKVNYTTDQPIIKVNYDDAPIYISTTVDATYIKVDYGTGGGAGGTIWGDIIGTLSDQLDLQAALDAKVPYTGATANVDLGEYELKAGQIELDQSPTGTAGVAVTRWNDTIGSTETTLKGGNVILKNGVDLVARVVNKVTPNTTLTKASYQAVKVSGAQGQRLAVALAQANNDNNSADTIGLVTETIATNQEGFIMTVGSLEGINTTGSLQGETWSDGDVLYLSPTIAGRLTNIKPNGSTGHIVVIGYVEYAHAINGKIYVKIMNGWELDELHNVFISSPANNDALIYESATSLWKNKSIATALGYTPGTVSSVALSVPTGLVITSGSPITTSGTIAVGLQSGYSIPTTIKQSNWDDAYTFVSAFPSQTGNSGKYLTTNGSTLSWGTVVLTPAGSNTQIQYNNSGAFGASAGLTYVDSTGTFTLTKNQDAQTNFFIRNTTVGNISDARCTLVSSNGEFTTGKYSSGTNTYKIVAANDGYLYNTASFGDIAILNDNTSGKIKFAAGGTSTTQMTLTAAGRLLLGTTTESTYLLDVNGTGRFVNDIVINGINLGKGINSLNDNTILGRLNGQSITTGNNNTAVGSLSSYSLQSGGNNVSFGDNCLYSNTTSSNNTALGSFASYSTTGANNTAVGRSALSNGAAATGNTAIGHEAGQNISGSNNTSIGRWSMKSGSGGINTAIGYATLYQTTGSQNIGIGNEAGFYNTTGSDQIFINSLPRLSYDGERNGSPIYATQNSTVSLQNLYFNGNVRISSSGSGTPSINTSAILEISSTTKGFLPPRMTAAQKTAISTPATGLVIYQTDSTEGLYQYKSTGWEAIGGGGTNIYNSDGTLTGNRTVTMGGNSLTFTGGDFFITNNSINAPLNLRNNNTAGVAAINFFNSSGVNTGAFGYAGSSYSGVNLRDKTYFYVPKDFIITPDGTNSYFKVFTGTGNITINGLTDAGYKLDVQGTARIGGTLFQTMGTNSINLIASGQTAQTTDRGIFIGGGTFGASSLSVGIGFGLNVGGGAGNTGNVAIGNSANATGGSIAISKGITAATASNGCIAIGGTASSGISIGGTSSNNAALAILGTASGYYAIAIGTNNNANADGAICIGNGSTANHSAILFGYNVKSTAKGQVVIGSSDGLLNGVFDNVYFGSGVQRDGVSNGVGINYTINGSGALGTDFAGGNITIAGGKGTGTGTPGDVIIATASTTTSGTTLQTLINRASIKGGTGQLILNAYTSSTSFTGTAAGYLAFDSSGNIITTSGTGGGGGGISRSVNNISTTTTAGAAASTDYVYLISGTTTLTLPTAVGNTNRYTLKNVGTNTVTINTTSSQTIDGSTSITMAVRYTALDVISDGTNWNII